MIHEITCTDKSRRCYINYTQHLCILTTWISRQQNCTNRTYQFLKELYCSQFALSYTRTLFGNKRTLVCSWPSWIRVSLYSHLLSRNVKRIFSTQQYIIMGAVSGCSTFFHILIMGSIFGKVLRNIMCVFWVSLQFTSEAFLILKKIQRDIIINVNTSYTKYSLFFVRF